jgi:type II secretory pathway pseudopilin PulG
MSTARDRPGLIHTAFLTVAISMLTAVLIGGLLYYTLKRHEAVHAQALERMAEEAQAQRALAAGHVVRAFSRHIMGDTARLQDLVSTGLDSEGLQNLMIVSPENVVLAAKNTAQVGQQVQDANWIAWTRQQREVAQRAVDDAGRPVMIMVEPLKYDRATAAWAMLVFALPEQAVSLQSPVERLAETAQLMAPIFVFLLVSIGWAMKLAAGSVRRQIQGVMASVLEKPAERDGKVWLRKVS